MSRYGEDFVSLPAEPPPLLDAGALENPYGYQPGMGTAAAGGSWIPSWTLPAAIGGVLLYVLFNNSGGGAVGNYRRRGRRRR